MGRKKKEQIPVQVLENADNVIQAHAKEIETNPQYSLSVDPLNQYNMSNEQKTFIHLYCEFKSKQLVQSLMGISTEAANAYYISYSSQQEIRRINRAMLQRRFQTTMMNLNEIGGYLTSLITEENVPEADRLPTKDKLQVLSMLKDLNVLKAESTVNNNVIDYNEVELAAKDMTIDAIKALLSAKKNNDENSKKETLISSLNTDNALLPEEIDYLKTLSVSELMSMLNKASIKK